MTEAQRSHLVYTRIQQAEQSILDAQVCADQDMPWVAVNRIYYGMFYAMLALGLLKDYETSKHQQIIGWFNKNFIHTGVFPKQFTQYVKDAYDARIDADYKIDEIPSADDLELLLANMRVFIATIKDYLDTQLRAE
jgi:uncharacterized protein (UPF0332 family)